MPSVLKTTDNTIVTATESESFNLRITLTDVDGTQLDAANTATVTLSLYDRDTSQVINGWNNLSIRNANGGTVTTGGYVDVRLDPADNPIIDTNLGAYEREIHIARVGFTWNDGFAVRTGREEFSFGVMNLPTLTT